MKKQKLSTELALFLGVFGGLFLGYSFRDTGLNNVSDPAQYVTKADAPAFSKQKNYARGTALITLDSASLLVGSFRTTLLHSQNDSLGNKLLPWPDTLNGWILDGAKLKYYLLQQRGNPGARNVTHIAIELGRDPSLKVPTLVFTGMERTIDGKYHKILSNSVVQYSSLARSANSENNILEYVDPCKSCP